MSRITVLGAHFSIAILLMASTPTLARGETGESSFLAFYLSIQERNLGSSVEYCASTKPSIERAYKRYLKAYRIGTKAGLERVAERLAPLSSMGNLDEMDELLSRQDRQGEKLLEMAKANPENVCAHILDVVSSLDAKAAEDRVMAIYKDYTAARKAHCQQSPTPDGCQSQP